MADLLTKRHSVMEYAYVSGARTFEVPFSLGILNEDHIQVYIRGETDGLGEQVFRDFSLDTDTMTVTVTDDISVPVGQDYATVVLWRTIPKDVLQVAFSNGADVTRTNLDKSQLAVMMAFHEVLDGRTEAYDIMLALVREVEIMSDQVAADRIVAAAAALSSSEDADQTALDRIAVAADRLLSQAAATTATTKAGEASSSASTATTAKNDAVAAKGLAETAASTATGAASAASGSASAASGSASAASGSASAASGSASAASGSASTASGAATTATTKAGEAATSATLAQKWAEDAGAPGGAGTKSAKTYAGEAETARNAVYGVRDTFLDDLTVAIDIKPPGTPPSGVWDGNDTSITLNLPDVATTWAAVEDKPAVIAAGATQADARTAIGLGSLATKNKAAVGDINVTGTPGSGTVLFGDRWGGVVGVGQTWQDVTSSRAVNTTYQNTTGIPISVSMLSGSAGQVQVSTDGSTWVTLTAGGSDSWVHAAFTVSPGHYYRQSGGSKVRWAESR